MINKNGGWHQQIQEHINDLAFLYCLNDKDILAFLTSTLSGQFALCELDEEFVRKTLDRMFESYKAIKQRMENEQVTSNSEPENE